MRIDVAIETALSTTIRARQVGALFDVPPADKCRLEWQIDFPYDAQPWNVGLVVGPSGSGKTTILRHVWGEPPPLEWRAASVIDDVAKDKSVEDIAATFGAVGFGTIPAWLRPYSVLSQGERFRVELARRLLELPDPVVVDEFTSVVDRQVAQIGSHAIQKYVRKHGRQFVAVGCHYDVVDWLQPDWVLDLATRTFTRRLLQRRPNLSVTIGRVHYSAWSLFAPYHYMSADLCRAARCFGLWVDDRLVSFAGILHHTHPHAKDLKRITRVVTLPDWQGLGLAFVLTGTLGSAYRALGYRLRNYPTHPSFVRAHEVSPVWLRRTESGHFRKSSRVTNRLDRTIDSGRPCATYEYCGPSMELRQAERLLAIRSTRAA